MFNSYKEESKKNWGTELLEGEKINIDQIQLGAILRIADAVEKMAQSYDTLIKDREYYKKAYSNSIERESKLSRSNAALRGVVKRLKNKK